VTGSPHPWPYDIAIRPWVVLITEDERIAHLDIGAHMALCGLDVFPRTGTRPWMQHGTRVCRRCLARLDRHIASLHRLRDALAEEEATA